MILGASVKTVDFKLTTAFAIWMRNKKMKITLGFLEEKNACKKGVVWFVNQKETDAVLVLNALINDKKLDWANWLIVRVMDRAQRLAYAIYAAEQVIDIYEKKYPTDDRPRKALEAAKRVLGKDTKENRNAAYAAANAAANAAADAMKLKILEYGISLIK